MTITPTADQPRLLMTPGPTRVPELVLRAGARPMIHHRTPEFSKELAEMVRLLGPVFGTVGQVLPVHTTGRGAMEAAICNFFSAGDEIAACCNGRFGEMWAAFAESYGLVVHRVCTDWARDVDPLEVERVLKEHPRVRGVTMTFGDTSTGVCNDVEAVCRVARPSDTLVMVDGVSSIGGMPFRFDEWSVDVAVTASQKCLMSAPGLSFAAVSARAWAANTRAALPRNYWDFVEIRKNLSKPRPEPPGTPPVHVVLQVVQALRMIHEEGLENVFRRHTQMSERVRRGVVELRLAHQFPELKRLSTTLTAIALPAGVAPKTIRERLMARGILTAAALGKHADTCFRIGHMGDIRMTDVERTMGALADALRENDASDGPAAEAPGGRAAPR